MRHLKADVSHRMKRRPSIFTAAWFRVILGLGVVVILGLLLGPSITGWLGGDGRPSPVAARATPKPPVAKAAMPTPPPAPTPAPAPAPAPVTPAVTPVPESPRPAAPLVATARPEPPAPTTAPPTATTPTKGTPAATASPRPSTEPSRPAGESNGGTPARTPAPAGSDGTVYRVQVGAFLDHRNADRLIDRLRTDGVEGVSTAVEETRTALYRVLAVPQDGEGFPLVLERLKALGFTPEPTDGGAIVVRPAPLTAALDVSRRLKEQGIRVRLEKQATSPGLRVVRVGAFATAEEAERARAELVARGYEGFVMREAR